MRQPSVPAMVMPREGKSPFPDDVPGEAHDDLARQRQAGALKRHPDEDASIAEPLDDDDDKVMSVSMILVLEASTHHPPPIVKRRDDPQRPFFCLFQLRHAT